MNPLMNLQNLNLENITINYEEEASPVLKIYYPAALTFILCPKHVNQIDGLLPGLWRAEAEFPHQYEGIQLFESGLLERESF